jgi:hypothetical protein
MPAVDEPSLAEETALRDQCTAFLAGHGPVTAAALLDSIPADTVPDRYGDGGVVAGLEAEITGLLGKQAAVFLPSGTMAQQSVLRVHADRRQRRTVIFHPMCHVDRHEEQAYQRLHGLTGSAMPPARSGWSRSATSSPRWPASSAGSPAAFNQTAPTLIRDRCADDHHRR